MEATPGQTSPTAAQTAGSSPDLPKPLPKHPDLQRPPAAAGEVRPATIYMNPEEYTRKEQELQQLREYKAQQQALYDQAEAARIKALADKGQIEEAFKQMQERHQAEAAKYREQAITIEREWLRERSDTEINAVLAGRTFAGADPQATAAIVRRLLSDEVEAVRDAQGNPVIRDRKTLRPAAEYLKERLEAPDMAIFFAATHRGGSGTDGARPAAATPKAQPGSFEEWAEAYREQAKAAQGARF